MVTWLNENSSAIQAISAVISVILAGVTIRVANKANKRAIENQEELRIHSSPKPFIEVTMLNEGQAKEYDVIPIINSDPSNLALYIQNIGQGIAVDMSFVINIIGSHTQTITKKTALILPPSEKGHIDFCIAPLVKENIVVEVEITYSSDSGYQRSEKWKCMPQWNEDIPVGHFQRVELLA